MSRLSLSVSTLVLAAACGSALADINVGMTLSMTGSGASLAAPTQNTVKLYPTEINGEKINYIVLDDGSDPSASTRNFQRLVEENKIDVMMGSNVTPATLSLVNIAAERKTPLISLAASARIVEPQDAVQRWVFKPIANESLMVTAMVEHMVAHKVKTLGFIGFSDPYGESWLNELKLATDKAGIQLAATERYGRTDTSVIAQALRLLGAKPDAVLVAGAGTPGALPQKTLIERGYKGRVYQTYGIANREFLKLAGKDAEGAVFAAGGVLVASQLDADNPVRKVALEAIKTYESAYGPDTMNVFAANAFDAGSLLRAALPGAMSKAKPGTEAFRVALRDSLEQVRGLVTTQGVINMGPQDHVGYDKRAAVMMQINNGTWKYLK